MKWQELMTLSIKKESPLTFIFLFFLLLGPKFFTFIDFGILVPGAIIICLVLSYYHIYIQKYFIGWLGILIALFCYSGLMQLANLSFDYQTLLRIFKTGIMFLIVIVYAWHLNRRGYPDISLLKVLLLVIFLNSCLIIIGAFSETAREILIQVTGNTKMFLFRSSGLFSGFDIAGMCSSFGILIAARIYAESRRARYIIISLFLLISVIFTSRASICIAILLFLYHVHLIWRYGNVFTRIFCLFSLFSIFYYLFPFILYAVEFTFKIGVADIPNEFELAFEQVFSANTLAVLKDMYFLPPDDHTLIFGSGAIGPSTDVGYVNDIFRYGLFVTIFLYGFLTLLTVTFAQGRNLKIICYILLFLILSLSFKNEYLFVRGIFPLFMFLIVFSWFQRRDFICLN